MSSASSTNDRLHFSWSRCLPIFRFLELNLEVCQSLIRQSLPFWIALQYSLLWLIRRSRVILHTRAASICYYGSSICRQCFILRMLISRFLRRGLKFPIMIMNDGCPFKDSYRPSLYSKQLIYNASCSLSIVMSINRPVSAHMISISMHECPERW